MTDEAPGKYLSDYLTQIEWKVVYGYWWIVLNRPGSAWAGVGYADGELMRRIGRMGRGFLWSIRQLAVRHKMKFTWIDVDSDGRISLKAQDPQFEANRIYLERLKRGIGPNMIALFEHMLTYIAEKELEIDTEPIHDTLELVRKDVAQAKADTPPEWEEAAVNTLSEGMRLAGFVAIPGKVRDRFNPKKRLN